MTMHYYTLLSGGVSRVHTSDRIRLEFKAFIRRSWARGPTMSAARLARSDAVSDSAVPA